MAEEQRVQSQPNTNLTQREKVYQQLDPDPVPVKIPEAQPQSIPLPPLERELQAKPLEAVPPKQTEAQPLQPQLYAGKYKEVSELERGYKEAESSMHKALQEKSELQKQVDYLKQNLDVSKLQQTNQQVTQQAVEQTAQNIDYLDLMVNDPQKFRQAVLADTVSQVDRALQLRSIEEQWEKDNPDLLPVRHWVSAEIQSIVLQDPNAMSDLRALSVKATERVRGFLNQARLGGKQEQTQMFKEVAGTSVASIPQTQSGAEQPPVQPQEPVGPFEAELQRRRDNFRKQTGGGLTHATGLLRPAFK